MDYIHTFIEYQRPFWMDFAAGSRKDPNINQLIIKHCLLPIPPQEEQRRIVTKLNQLYPYINQYGNSQNRLNQINKEIWHNLKKSILQEAIQGKLVPQIAEEGIAQDLLEQIRQEKQKLVKEGKLKKSALTDSVIYKGDDNKYYERINEQIVEIELPFEYPNSWVVLRLKDICQLIDGEKRTGKGICLDAKYLRGKSSAAVIDKGKFVYAGDNIILVDGENSGEVFSVPQDGYMGSTFKQLWLSSVMWKPYILAFILFVSIRPTTDIEPLYTTIATVTMNLIVAVAIVLLNLYVVVSAGPRIPPFVLSMHFSDVAVSICVEAVPVVPHELPFYNKAFGR